MCHLCQSSRLSNQRESCYSRDMDNEPLDQRVPLMMSRSQIAAVDQWRREQPDIPSRSEAIRRLIEKGIAAS